MDETYSSALCSSQEIISTTLLDICNLQLHQFDLNFPDIIRLEDGYDIEDAITGSYDNDGVEDTAIIVRSNKRANQYNQQIRSQIRGQENEISPGDYVMVVKNNYYWF